MPQGLWQANVDLVAAIKATEQLRENLVRYTRSSRLYIRKEHKRFRIRIGELLRDLAVLRDERHDTVLLVSLDSIRVALADNHRFSHQVVDSLIRDAAITPQVATSLMNDSLCASEIMERLLGMAEGLVASSAAVNEQMPDLSLTAEEVQQVVDRMHEGASPAAQGESPR